MAQLVKKIKMATFYRGENLTEILDEEILEHHHFNFMFTIGSDRAFKDPGFSAIAINELRKCLIEQSKRKANEVQNERNQKGKISKPNSSVLK